VFKLTPIIQVISAAVAIFATLNWLILMLADKITQFIPMRLSPLTTYMDTIIAFGVGAGVYCLATMAHNSAKHH
jgi:hypothetical protein